MSASGDEKSTRYSSAVRSCSLWLPKMPTHMVPTTMHPAPLSLEGVSRSPRVHGAMSTFHTTTIPAIGAMMDWAAKPYAEISKAGSIMAVQTSPSG